MKPIATPIVGGMLTSTIHVLIVTPVIFYLMKTHALRKGTLRMSAMSEHATGREVLDGAL
jgi:Cu(I)/Ag(I) efflux system membrane protein CusA/SilA